MVQTISSVFNKFFIKLEPARAGIFRSSGIAVIYFWISASGFFHKLSINHLDRRKKSKIKYSLLEIIQFIVLHILDGDKRISHYDRNPNKYLFLCLFKWIKVPSQSTVLKSLKSNPAFSRILNHFILNSCIEETVKFCQVNQKKMITIDVDQTARVLHGKQKGVDKGYHAGKRNASLYQIRVYAVREMKQTMRVRLMSGNIYSSNYFLSEIKLIAKKLSKAGITARFVGDSGFEVGAVCDFLHKNGHEFIFAVKKRKDVKRRGKYSKNKKKHYSDRLQIKERIRPVTNRFGYPYREIYVQVLSDDGQLWFDFAADHFTNVLVTNLDCSALYIYKLYKQHAVIETIIEELKNDFGAGLAHCDDFAVNSIMTTCTGIAYNIKNKILDTGVLDENSFRRCKLSTLQSMWLHTPGEIVKASNRYKLKIAPERYEQFKKILAA